MRKDGLGQESRMDIGKNTTACNMSWEEFIELFVVTQGEHDVSRDDANAHIVARSVSSQLEHLSSYVLHAGSKIDTSSISNAQTRFQQKLLEKGHREGEPSTRTLRTSVARLTIGLVGAELDDGLSPLSDSVVTEFPAQNHADRGLDVHRAHCQTRWVDFTKLRRLSTDTLGQI